jgi:predicted ATPase
LRKTRDEELIGKHMLKLTQSLVEVGRITMGNASITEYIPMIREVSIENFKGVRHSEIKDLGKVNLFIGKNSCGKSTIMEAIYFTGKEFIGANLPLCIIRRADRESYSARELWYGYDMMSSEVQVRMKFGEDDWVRLRIQYIEQEKMLRDFLYSGSPQTGQEDIGRDYYPANFSHCGGHRPDLHTNHNTEIRRFFDRSVFIDPTVKTDVKQIEGNYLNILKLSEADSSDLAKRTAEIYDTKPSWEFLPHPDFPPDNPSRFAILEGNRRMFFDNFGDGLHYGLAVLAVAKTRTNTALFIEEIESHQHPEAIGKLISNLVEIARMNNLQLFITTHSRIVWSFFEKAFETEDARQRFLRVYRVVRDGETGHVECIPQTKQNADEFWSAVDKDLYGPTDSN